MATSRNEEINVEELSGLIQTTSTVPDYVPASFYEQFVIYKNGTTRRLYWYDAENNEWVYTSGSV
jgi:hypothetical protein